MHKKKTGDRLDGTAVERFQASMHVDLERRSPVALLCSPSNFLIPPEWLLKPRISCSCLKEVNANA